MRFENIKSKIIYNNYSLSFIDFMRIFCIHLMTKVRNYQFAKKLDLGLNLYFIIVLNFNQLNL